MYHCFSLWCFCAPVLPIEMILLGHNILTATLRFLAQQAFAFQQFKSNFGWYLASTSFLFALMNVISFWRCNIFRDIAFITFPKLFSLSLFIYDLMIFFVTSTKVDTKPKILQEQLFCRLWVVFWKSSSLIYDWWDSTDIPN